MQTHAEKAESLIYQTQVHKGEEEEGGATGAPCHPVE